MSTPTNKMTNEHQEQMISSCNNNNNNSNYSGPTSKRTQKRKLFLYIPKLIESGSFSKQKMSSNFDKITEERSKKFPQSPHQPTTNASTIKSINTSATIVDMSGALMDNKTINVAANSLLNLNKRIAPIPPVKTPPLLTPLSPVQKVLTMPTTIYEEEIEKSGKSRATITGGSCKGHQDDDALESISESQVLVTPDEQSTPRFLVLPPTGSVLTLNKVSQDSVRNRIRLGNRRIRRRAIFKNGDCNIIQSKPAKDRIRFIQDFFTTLVDTQWRWTLLCFALSFFVSWLIFALIWWLIAFCHGDLEPEHLPDKQGESNWTPCVVNIWGFTSCYLFSIETQHTIGYGSRSTTEECPEAVFIMSMQSILGVIIQALMVGIVFAKMSRPKHRTQTLLFSKNAVVCQRDNKLCLMFRVGDMAKSHIIGASIKARLIRSKSTTEGEILNYYQEELEISADGCAGDLFFIWPMTIVHVIDENSPLYHLTARDMLQERFEIVVILEGTIESTGQSTQARSSYINSEILWGHRFETVVFYNKEKQGYEVDLSKFNNTIAVDTPLCSGAELESFYKTQEKDGVLKEIPLADAPAPPVGHVETQ
ncbi:G protein-activated inward rectifier potassium channel 3 isoform X2 [Agrilus planipennis]|uniref:G protein-activated inward rectifier potassium channel 3 isoform X2 n=1 Tax=Agrilus planipennis TaxID=224129 RepID=A0A7F5RMA5_AGRPL|nr:G protein-activated inward rectifier potassium channel 3 isoform X2 [Agrilus planipennis]